MKLSRPKTLFTNSNNAVLGSRNNTILYCDEGGNERRIVANTTSSKILNKVNFVKASEPNATTVWTRGSNSAVIRWNIDKKNVNGNEKVTIYLIQHVKYQTFRILVASDVSLLEKQYKWRNVPWGLPPLRAQYSIELVISSNKDKNKNFVVESDRFTITNPKE